MGQPQVEDAPPQSKPANADEAALALLMAWPRLILAGVLGIGAGFAAAWLTTIASLFLLPSGAAEFPSYVGPLTGVVGVAAGIGVFVGVSRSLRQDASDETSIWNRPPGLVFGLTVWLVCLWVAYLLTDFGDFGMLLLFFGAAIALLVLGVTWLVRLVVVVSRRRFEFTRESVAGWLLGPAAVVALMAFGSWDGTRHLRFELSESALTTDAQELLANIDEDDLGSDGWLHMGESRRVGVLEVDWVNVNAECTAAGSCDPGTASVEYEIYGGFFSTYTYIYSPGSQPADAGWGIEHLGGPWWFREFHD
jgi:hypothetical protein